MKRLAAIAALAAALAAPAALAGGSGPGAVQRAEYNRIAACLKAGGATLTKAGPYEAYAYSTPRRTSYVWFGVSYVTHNAVTLPAVATGWLNAKRGQRALLKRCTRAA